MDSVHWTEDIIQCVSRSIMMMSSNGNIFHVTGPLRVEFPAQRPVIWCFDVFFDLHLNKRLSKQWWGWWFEMPSHLLWRHCNIYTVHASLYFVTGQFYPYPTGLLLTTLVLGQSYDCPSGSGVTLKGMGKCTMWIWQSDHSQTDYNKKCSYFMGPEWGYTVCLAKSWNDKLDVSLMFSESW